MANGSEKYQADRGNNQEESSEAGKKTAKVAAKAAADYFTGGKGGAVVDKLADTKLGNQVLDKAGKVIDKNPALNKAAQKLNDSGALDAADKGLSMMESGGAASGTNNIAEGVTSNKSTTSIMENKEDSLMSQNESSSNINSKDDNKLMSTNSFSSNKEISGIAEIFGFGGIKVKLIMIGFGVIIFFMFAIIAIISGDEELSSGDSNSNLTNINGSCIYKINGFVNSSKTIKLSSPIEISNLKVRLMECDGSKPVAGEELVDFEKYILGVTYQENGSAPDEAVKVQAIAARSYSLARPTFMGNAGGTKLSEENGQWILQLRACTNDHAYCDPDKGCWSDRAGGEGATIHSGQDTSKAWSRGPVAQDAKLRTLVSETVGQVLVDQNEYIYSTNYMSTEQNSWNSSASSGLNYKQILLQQYPKSTDILQVSCSTGSGSYPTGDFTLWKQGGAPWSSIRLGNSSSNIGSAGCLVTSISMLIAKSGVKTNVNGEFNPGTFVEKLNANGGFVGANLYWAKVSAAAPNFVYQGKVYVLGLSKSEKLNRINNLLNNGYYVTAEVKGNTGQHWVAIASTDQSNVYMMDPASDSINMWQQYNWGNTSTLAYFKVS